MIERKEREAKAQDRVGGGRGDFRNSTRDRNTVSGVGGTMRLALRRSVRWSDEIKGQRGARLPKTHRYIGHACPRNMREPDKRAQGQV